MSESEQTTERILILCVDRDNDVGKKADVRTPIIGRQDNMSAATKLILKDPEEADANAMFEAIRIYDSLEGSKSGEEYEVSTIAGSEVGGIAADRKLVSELTSTLERFKASSIVLVTDGFADEDVLPLVQSRVPVTSVRRIIVKHSESIEETAAVLSRYLKMLIEDPRYSRIALGLPGVLLIVLGILWIISVSYPEIFGRYGLPTYAWIISLIIVGASLLIRGYRLDERFSGFYRWLSQIYLYTLPRLITGFSLTAGLLLIGIGFFQAGSYVAVEIVPSPLPSDPSVLLEYLPRILGSFISKSVTLLIIGICIALGGRMLRHLFDRDSRFWRTLAFTVVCTWSWEIFNEASLILIDPTLPSDRLILAIIMGIVVTIASGWATYMLSSKYEKFFESRDNSQE